jgi:peptidyl-tRNA hydrolase, PTH1 family
VFVIVGLGNPGNKYEFTRHNIGFRIVDSIAVDYNVLFKSGKGDYYFSEFKYNGDRVILVKPVTFMNNTGLAIHQILKYFPVSIENLLIVYDDFNLPFGTLRFRKEGSDGGHNGLKSIIYHLHSNVFDRLRFGIGTEFKNSVSFVLSKFKKDEEKEIDTLISAAKAGVENWIVEGIESSMNKYNKMYL